MVRIIFTTSGPNGTNYKASAELDFKTAWRLVPEALGKYFGSIDLEQNKEFIQSYKTMFPDATDQPISKNRVIDEDLKNYTEIDSTIAQIKNILSGDKIDVLDRGNPFDDRPYNFSMIKSSNNSDYSAYEVEYMDENKHDNKLAGKKRKRKEKGLVNYRHLKSFKQKEL